MEHKVAEMAALVKDELDNRPKSLKFIAQMKRAKLMNQFMGKMNAYEVETLLD
jgi:hypothetical protein